MPFVKLHGTILDSSIWLECETTRLMWITMLAMADEHGVVQASVGGLAHRARVSREACEKALATFLSPDPDSRDGTTGERIEKVPGGWLLLNHAEYRDRQTLAQAKTAARVARHRASRRDSVTCNEVTPGNELSPSEAEAEAERKEGRKEGKGEAPAQNGEAIDDASRSDANGVPITKDRLYALDCALCEAGVLVTSPSKRLALRDSLVDWGFDGEGIPLMLAEMTGKTLAQRTARLVGVLRKRETAEALWNEVCRKGHERRRNGR